MRAEEYNAAKNAKHNPPAGWPSREWVEAARKCLSAGLSDVGADALPLHWTTWPSVREVRGRVTAGTWLDLLDTLTAWRHDRAPAKDRLPCWAPGRFNEGRRADEATEELDALALDCDNHGEWAAVREALEALGLAYLAHRTPTHGVDGATKWRLVLPLSSPVAGDSLALWGEWYNAARIVLGAVGGAWFDPSTCNPSRLWFPPIALGDAEPREVVEHAGHALNLEALARAFAAVTPAEPLPLPATALPLGQRVRAAGLSATLRQTAVELSPVDRAERWLDKRDGAIEGQGGDQHTFATAAALVVDFDLDDADALRLLEGWNVRCSPKWTTDELEAKIARARKYGKHAAGAKLNTPTTTPTTAGAVWTPPEAPRGVPGPAVYDHATGAYVPAAWATAAPLPAVTLAEWDSGRFKLGEAPAIAWLVDDTFALGEAVMLAAPGDAGKGMMTLNLALHVAAGQDTSWATAAELERRRPFGRRWTGDAGRAVVLAGEDNAAAIHRRLDALDAGGRVRAMGRLTVVPLPSVGGAFPLVREDEAGELVSTSQWAALEEQLGKLENVRLVVIDPLSAFSGALDINNNPTVGQRLTNRLSTLAERLNATVVVCHHMRKAGDDRGGIGHEVARERIRGTTGLVDGLRAAYALLPVASKQARGVLELFGLRGAFDVGRVYWGALVKSNNPVDRAERLYVRNMATGLLEDMTAELVRKTETAGLTEALEAVEKRGEEAPRARRRGNPAADRAAGEGVGYEPR